MTVKKIFLIHLILLISALSCFATEDEDLKLIESVIKEAALEFEVAKDEKDLKKLAAIAEKLYKNHQLIKKLLGNTEIISLKCNDNECTEPILQVGDKLTLIFNLSFPPSEEYEKSKLIWQIQHNKKIVKDGDKEIYEKGGVKKFAKELTIDESYQTGKYRIAVHHQTSTGKIKADAFFQIKKPITVRDIVTSTNREATVSDNLIYPDEDIYILSGFKLANPEGKINIDVKLTDTTKQEILIETSFIRPKDDNNEPDQPLTFLIPASKLYAQQQLAFEMKLYGDTINPILKNTTISINKYKLRINVPNTLQAGKSGRYSIVAPRKFIEPFAIDIDPSGGILLSHKTELSGIVEAINNSTEKGLIKVTITDTKGRTVSSSVAINLTVQKAEQTYTPTVTLTPPQTPSSQSPQLGDTRERKEDTTVYYERYQKSGWRIYKEIDYYPSGAKRYVTEYGKEHITLYKLWSKDGSLGKEEHYNESTLKGWSKSYYKSGNLNIETTFSMDNNFNYIKSEETKYKSNKSYRFVSVDCQSQKSIKKEWYANGQIRLLEEIDLDTSNSEFDCSLTLHEPNPTSFTLFNPVDLCSQNESCGKILYYSNGNKSTHTGTGYGRYFEKDYNKNGTLSSEKRYNSLFGAKIDVYANFDNLRSGIELTEIRYDDNGNKYDYKHKDGSGIYNTIDYERDGSISGTCEKRPYSEMECRYND